MTTILDPSVVSKAYEYATALTQLCQKHRVWVEARGDELVMLTLTPDGEEVVPFTLVRIPQPSVQNSTTYGLVYLEINP